MKFGCCISIKNIPLAKSYGYDFVELSATEIMNINDNEWPRIKDYILSNNIEIIGFNAFCNEKIPLIGPFSKTNKWDLYLNKVLLRASELGCKNIGIGAPKARIIPLDYNYNLATKQMINFLKCAAIKAKEYNINILYEALNPKECNFCNSTIEAINTINEINSDNIYIVYDVYHAVNSNESYKDCTKYLKYINHIHINSWDKNLNRYFLFENDINYINDLINILNEYNYSKTISIEANDSNFKVSGKIAIDILNKFKN